MAALTLDALLKSLRKGASRAPEPVYLLSGDEDVLKDEAIRALVEATVGPPSSASRDFNVDTRFCADVTPESFHTLVNTVPMFAERRIVVLRGVDQIGKRKTKLRDEVIRYLEAPSPTTVLVLVVSAGEDADTELARHAAVVNLTPLAAERVPKWINHYASTLGLTLTSDAVELLIEAVGNDLGGLSRELEKLAALRGKSESATAEDVTALVGVRRGETIHDLVEAALERKAARAAELVEPVLEQAGMTGVRIVTLLGTHLVGTALARAERDHGGAARLQDRVFRHMLAARPYGLRGYKDEAARWANWSALWTRAELARALKAALAADTQLKSPTVTDDRGIVTRLVLEFAATKQEAA